MDIDEVLNKIIDEIVESDISAYDFKVVNEIITKYKEIQYLKGVDND